MGDWQGEQTWSNYNQQDWNHGQVGYIMFTSWGYIYTLNRCMIISCILILIIKYDSGPNKCYSVKNYSFITQTQILYCEMAMALEDYFSKNPEEGLDTFVQVLLTFIHPTLHFIIA